MIYRLSCPTIHLVWTVVARCQICISTGCYPWYYAKDRLHALPSQIPIPKQFHSRIHPESCFRQYHTMDIPLFLSILQMDRLADTKSQFPVYLCFKELRESLKTPLINKSKELSSVYFEAFPNHPLNKSRLLWQPYISSSHH